MQTCRAIYKILSAEKQITRWMRMADLFDEGKVIAYPREVSIDLAETDTTIERAEILMKILIEGFEESRYDLWFCHLLGVDRYDAFLKNRSVLPYWNKNVREISTGEQYGLFHNYIESFGFLVETTQDMYIKQISFE
jgi:hypothetical protein